ncbi:MAG: hypothetical protein AVDCRST_MAG08-3649, partial [uncultured Acetobacteraceae bacterium]
SPCRPSTSCRGWRNARGGDGPSRPWPWGRPSGARRWPGWCRGKPALPV